jgi:tetratricopeptide (TPR) repeat protein
VRSYLDAYGELRDGGGLTEDERDLLAHPARLGERIPLRKERPSERLLYLCGLDLLRLGRFRESLDCFDRIGVPSLYYPWALYGAAQDLYAADEIEHALEVLARLRRLPPAGAAESELANRAGLLGMQLLFDAGHADEAAQSAGEIAGGGRSGVAARLLRAEIALVGGSPSLAITLFGDLDPRRLDSRLDAERSLGLAEAYARLGDAGSAVAHLRTAAGRLARDRARLEPPSDRAEVERLIVSVTADAASLGAEAAGRRRQIVLGIRRVLAVRGPMNLGKLARIVVMPHRSSIVGRAVYDLSGVSKSDSRIPALTVGAGDARTAYLASPLRRSIEAAAAARLDIESASGAESALPVVSALLGLLDGRFGARGEARAAVVQMVSGLESVLGSDAGGVAAIDSGAPLASRARALRGRLLESLGPHAEPPALAGDLLAAARREAIAALDAAVTEGLRHVVAAEARELRGVEFEVDSALSDAMLRQNAAARSRAAGP